MYKQARQLLLMKQAAKKNAEVSYNHALKKDAEVSVHKPLAELKHIIKVHENAHTEHCNLLVAVVTLVVLLAVSQQTVKLPQDAPSAWSGHQDELPEGPVLEPEQVDVPPELG